MIIYRPAGYLLSDTKDKCREFETVEEMIKFISEDYCLFPGKPLYQPEDIVLHELAFPDERIGWEDCRQVCVKSNNELRCIGWCATKYTK